MLSKRSRFEPLTDQAHPTHLSMAAKGARKRPFFIASQEVTLAANVAAVDRHWLPP